MYISEKIVSFCPEDILPKEREKLSPLAKFLSKFASTNDSAGIGVHNVYKMQVAMMLCGRMTESLCLGKSSHWLFVA